jgi:hypothetical protein
VLNKDSHPEKGCCLVSKECGKMVKWACRLRNACFFLSLSMGEDDAVWREEIS